MHFTYLVDRLGGYDGDRDLNVEILEWARIMAKRGKPDLREFNLYRLKYDLPAGQDYIRRELRSILRKLGASRSEAPPKIVF